MKQKSIIGLALLLCWILYGCDNLNQAIKSGEKIKELEIKILELQVANEYIRKNIDDLLKRNENLLNICVKNSIELNKYKSPVISFGGEGYSYIKNDFGNFFIACDNISPYSNGSKVKLRIGNPYSVKFDGIKLLTTSNTSFDKVTDYSEWEKTKQEKEYDLTTVLPAGSWTTVEIVIPNFPPDKLGYLSVEMTTDKLSLFKR